MSAFSEAARTEALRTLTENGAAALKSTGCALVDFFSTAGALRNPNAGTRAAALGAREAARARVLFDRAWDEDPLRALKILFYVRDVRGGLGERTVFRTLLRHAAEKAPDAVRRNLDLIPFYGRFDDWYALRGTPVEADMWLAAKTRLTEDTAALEAGRPVSLLAKWLATADASSDKTRRLGIETALKLGMKVRDYKRLCRALRRAASVVEPLMSAGRWTDIAYAGVPSRAMLQYRNAFLRHDGERFDAFVRETAAGRAAVHADTLFPYDIVEKYLSGGAANEEERRLLEAQWKALPDYAGDRNILVMADVSGSMYGRPLASSIGLALYFAERSKGAFRNLFMTFSSDPAFVRAEGDTLYDRIMTAGNAGWGFSTNIEAAFAKILETALEHRVPPEEMPESLVIITDMQFDAGTMPSADSATLHRSIARKYAEAGYRLPNTVYWNVASRRESFQVSAGEARVQLVSGQSASTFRTVLAGTGLTPCGAMLLVIDGERYSPVTL